MTDIGKSGALAANEESLKSSPTRVVDFEGSPIYAQMEETVRREKLAQQQQQQQQLPSSGARKKKKTKKMNSSPHRPSQSANISLPTLEEITSVSSGEGDANSSISEVSPEQAPHSAVGKNHKKIAPLVEQSRNQQQPEPKQEVEKFIKIALHVAARGKEEEAIKLYERALLSMRPNFEDIQQRYQQAIKSSPNQTNNNTTAATLDKKNLREEWQSSALSLAEVITSQSVLFERMGQYSNAIRACEEAKEVYERCKTRDIEQHLEQMDFMLSSLKKAKETFQARKQLQEKAISLRFKIASTTQGDRKEELYRETFQVLIRALEMEKEALGERHPQVADTTQVFAVLHLERQGESDRAIKYMRSAVQILRLALGKYHPRTCMAIRQLAKMYETVEENLQEAITQYEQSIVGFRECFGNHHSMVGATLNNVAVLYIQKGDYAKAIEKLSDALICYEASSVIVTEGAQVWKNMGECYMRRGDFESAHFAYTSALEVQRDARYQAENSAAPIAAGFDDANIGDTMLRLGRTMKETMRYEDSYQIYREALLIYRMHYRATRKMKGGAIADAKDRLAHTLYCMAEVQEIRGNYDEALKYFSDSLQLRLESDASRTASRMNMVHCAMALCGVGNVHMRRGEYNDAKLGFQEAVRYLNAHGVPQDHDLMKMMKGRLQCAIEEKPILGSSSFSDDSTEEAQIKKSSRTAELDRRCQEQIEAGDYDAAVSSLASALAVRRRKLTKRQKADQGSTEKYLKEREEVAETLGTFALVLSKKNESKQASMLVKEALRMHASNGFDEDNTSVRRLNKLLDELNV